MRVPRFTGLVALLVLLVFASASAAGPLRERFAQRRTCSAGGCASSTTVATASESVVVAPSSSTVTRSSTTTTTTTRHAADSPEALLELVNAQRARLRLAPLALAADLVEHSRVWSNHMQRVGLRHSLRYGGEVIAWNYTDAQDVFGGWMRSPGHRRALMDPAATTFGAYRVGVYWTAVAR